MTHVDIIFGLSYQVVIRYFEFVKYWIKMGV